jgi:hypothetical protein
MISGVIGSRLVVRTCFRVRRFPGVDPRLGHYELHTPIVAGGMGAVYRARNTKFKLGIRFAGYGPSPER